MSLWNRNICTGIKNENLHYKKKYMKSVKKVVACTLGMSRKTSVKEA
jgi:hypothetical protein